MVGCSAENGVGTKLRQAAALTRRIANKAEFKLDRQRFRGWQDREALKRLCAERYGYIPSPNPLAEMCRLLNVSNRHSEFMAEWSAIEGSNTLDADPLFSELLYTLVRELRPSLVVETGVARGVSSRMILAGLHSNGHGHLTSIDVYRGRDRAAAVPQRIRDRWSLLDGTSRKHLRRSLADGVDLFVHDSQHTRRNMRFEFFEAWRRLRPGGVLVADDIHENDAFALFVRTTACMHIIGQEGRKAGLFALATR